MEVPHEVLQKFVCENCNSYLSRGPVHLMDSVRYRCGRCLPSEEEPGTRIEAYEELAELMTFPCRYQRNGCTSKVPFAENEAHEEACPYREYICPIADSGECEWTGIQTELLEHCRQHHPDNVLEDPCKLTHNITRSSLHNYLLRTIAGLFLLQTKVCTISRKIYHSVRLIGDPASASDYKYTLLIQNKDSKFSIRRIMAPLTCLAFQYDSSIQTDIIALQTMLEDFTDTTFTVTISFASGFRYTGCQHLIIFGPIKIHEKRRAHKPFDCPFGTRGTCGRLRHSGALLEHCQHQHPEVIVSNGFVLKNDVNISQKRKFLIKVFNELFLISTEICRSTDFLYHSVQIISASQFDDTFCYEMIVNNGDNSLTKWRTAVPYGAEEENLFEKTPLLALLGILNGYTSIGFILKTGRLVTMEREAVCSELMRPTPISYHC